MPNPCTIPLACLVATLGVLAGASPVHATSYESGGKVDLVFGAYTESIPITVPPFHGIEPKLAINYNSSSGNGVLGVGWSLQGLSVIELVPGHQFLGIDYYLGTQFSLEGQGSLYTLDGQRLIPCGSQSAATPSPSCEPGARTTGWTNPSIGLVNYSTLSESYLKIEYIDASAGIWNVWRKDGTKTVYAKQGSSKFLLSTVTDTFGNTVTYHWNVPAPNNNFQFNHIDSISYNGTVIKFYYGNRALNESYASDYVLDTMNKQLVSVDVCVHASSGPTTACSLGGIDARRARAYKLAYKTSAGTGRPLLTSVQMFGKDAVLGNTTGSVGAVASGSSLPPMTFTWNDVAPTYTTTQIAAVADWGDPSSRGMVDWDGDGATDFCRIIGSNNFITCLFGGGFWSTRGDSNVTGTATSWGEANTRAYADWDGDGKTDFCRLVCEDAGGGSCDWGGEAWYWRITCSFSNGTSMSDQAVGPRLALNTEGVAGERFFTDWNGDGKADFCRKAIDQNTVIGGVYGYYNAGWFCAISTGRGGYQDRFIGPLEDYSNANNGFPIATTPGTPAIVDYNGDGRSDYCRVVTGGSHLPGTPGTTKILCLLGAPATFDGTPEALSHDYAMLKTNASGAVISGGISTVGWADSQYWVDVNGDGKSDYCRLAGSWPQINPAPLVCNISTQNSSIEVIWGSLVDGGEWKSRRWGDLDGDGKTDYCRQNGGIGGSGKICGTSDGLVANATVNTQLASVSSFDTKHWMTDWNGDGRDEYCFNGGSAGQAGSFLYCLHRDEYAMADLVVGLQNGLGGDTAVDYAPSSKWTPTTQAPNNNPPVIATVEAVVDRLVAGLPSGNITSYRYSGGTFDAYSGRFLGFGWARVTRPCDYDEATCPYTETKYGLDARFPTKPLEVTDFGPISSTNIPVVGKTYYNYTNVYAPSAVAVSPYRADPVYEQVYVYDDAGQYQVSRVTREFDKYGNLTVEDHDGLYYDSTNPGASQTGDDRRLEYAYFPNVDDYIVDKAGSVTGFASVGSGGIMVTDALFVYDDPGASWATPPTQGRAVKSYRWLDTSGYLETSATYDSFGNLLTETDAEGAVRSYAIDGVYHQYVTKVTNPAAGGRPAPPITFKWVATDCSAASTITFRINGQVAYAGAAASSCTCDPGIGIATVTDPAVLALVTQGTNTLSVQYDGYYLAWAKVNLGSQRDVAIFDHDGGNNATEETPGLCASGYTASLGVVRSAQASLAPLTAIADFVQTMTTDLGDFDVQCGQKTKETLDQNALSTTYTFDDLCRKTGTFRPSGGWELIAYNNLGTVNATTSSQHTQVTLATGSGTLWSRTYFDRLGRTTKIMRQGPSGVDIISAEYTFTPRGKISQSFKPRYANAVDAYYAKNEYDVRDRLNLVYPMIGFSESKTISYGLGRAETTDELGHTQATWVNTRGQTVKTCTKVAGACAGDETSYVYDGRGHLSSITQQLGAAGSGRVSVTTLGHDSLGRKTSMSDPDAGDRTFAYDDVGDLIDELDGNGSQTHYTYDALRRRTSKTINYCAAPSGCPGQAPAVTSTWTYDEARPGFYNVGRLTSMTDPSGAATYDYDRDGNLVSSGRTVDADAYTFTKSYDLAGRLLATSYPDGSTVGTLTYDGAGRLASIPGFVDAAVYDAAGNLTKYWATNGTETTYDTDNPEQELEGYSTKGPQSPSGLTAILGTYARSQTQSATQSWAIRNFDDYPVAMAAGQTLTVSTCSTAVAGGSGSGDTFLRLLDSGESELVANDDAGGTCGFLSTMTFTATSTDTYIVRAGCYSASTCSATVAYKITNPISNVALFKPAIQSSTGPWWCAGLPEASKAVDGGLDGNFWSCSVSHTNYDATPYWMVNLGGSFAIDRIEIYNRTDGGGDRLANFDVYVYNASEGWVMVSHLPGVAGAVTTIPVTRLGELVFIRLRDPNYLNLAEVQVHGSVPVLVSSRPVLHNVSLLKDAEGRIEEVVSNRAFEAWEYRYSPDGLHQLTLARNRYDDSLTQAFSYDPTGNLTSTWGQVGTYGYPTGSDPVRPHAVTTTGLGAYTYDDNGQMISKPGASYTWDGAGHLVSANNTATNYTYDAEGYRLKKYHAANYASTVYLGDDYEKTTWNYQASISTKYVSLGGRVIGKESVGNGKTWLYTNHQGSVAFALDSNGAEVSSASYRAYGADITAATVNARGYTGQSSDETGLLYLHARFYDPTLGRFLSPDPTIPTHHSVGLNRYAYGRNDPANRTDIDGLGAWQDFENGFQHVTGEWARGVRITPMIGGTLALLPTMLNAASRGDGEVFAKAIASEIVISHAIAVSIVLSAVTAGGATPAAVAALTALNTGLSVLSSAVTAFTLTMINSDGDVLKSITNGLVSAMISAAMQGGGSLIAGMSADAGSPLVQALVNGQNGFAAVGPFKFAVTGHIGWNVFLDKIGDVSSYTVAKAVAGGLFNDPHTAVDSRGQAIGTSRMSQASSASGALYGYGYEQTRAPPPGP